MWHAAGFVADCLPEGQTQTDKAHTDKAQTDKAHTDKAHTDKPHTDKAQTDKPHTDKAHTDKAHTDKAQTDKAQTEGRIPNISAIGAHTCGAGYVALTSQHVLRNLWEVRWKLRSMSRRAGMRKSVYLRVPFMRREEATRADTVEACRRAGT